MMQGAHFLWFFAKKKGGIIGGLTYNAQYVSEFLEAPSMRKLQDPSDICR